MYRSSTGNIRFNPHSRNTLQVETAALVRLFAISRDEDHEPQSHETHRNDEHEPGRRLSATGGAFNSDAGFLLHPTAAPGWQGHDHPGSGRGYRAESCSRRYPRPAEPSKPRIN